MAETIDAEELAEAFGDAIDLLRHEASEYEGRAARYDADSVYRARHEVDRKSSLRQIEVLQWALANTRTTPMDKPIIAEISALQVSVLGLTLAPECCLVAVLRPDQIDLIADAVIARLDKRTPRIAELEAERESLQMQLDDVREDLFRG